MKKIFRPGARLGSWRPWWSASLKKLRTAGVMVTYHLRDIPGTARAVSHLSQFRDDAPYYKHTAALQLQQVSLRQTSSQGKGQKPSNQGQTSRHRCCQLWP